MAGHAKLSPSAASRWMACTPSAVLESTLPDKTSVFAEEGTLAHAICESMLREYHGIITTEQHEENMAGFYGHELFQEEMIGYSEGYVDFVNSSFVKGSTIFIEQKLDMTNYIEEGFGTADALVLRTGVLNFFDLKYGKGVPVYADNNKQLMIYALGALNDYGHIFDVDVVRLNIYQPRLDNVSVWETTVEELIHWADTELEAKAKLAFRGEGEYQPGSHCGFCRAKARCRALADFNMAIAKDDFKQPDLLSDEEIADILARKTLFTNWIEAVSGFAYSEALSGKQWPGWKLVEGRSIRKYVGESIVAENLQKAGFTDIFKKPALIGITEMTKKLGKKSFETHVEPLLIKPEGKPALVIETDNRPALSSPSSDFDDGFDLI